MGQPNSAVPYFDFESLWGKYTLTGKYDFLLKMSHFTPPLLSPITKLLRRPLKYSLQSPLDILVWGLRLRLLPRGNISEQKLYTSPKSFDPPELKLMQRLLKPGGTFVDIGANAGIYSFWAHVCMNGNGTILAVEPDPEMKSRIEFNISTNNIKNIEVCSLALSDYDGNAKLLVNPKQRGQNTLEKLEADSAGGKREELEVEVKPLYHFLRNKNITKIDVLKIDIEGHEPTVLRHFLNNAPVEMWPKAVISEFKNNTADDIFKMLADNGYRQKKVTKLNCIFEKVE